MYFADFCYLYTDLPRFLPVKKLIKQKWSNSDLQHVLLFCYDRHVCGLNIKLYSLDHEYCFVQTLKLLKYKYDMSI